MDYLDQIFRDNPRQAAKSLLMDFAFRAHDEGDQKKYEDFVIPAIYKIPDHAPTVP